MNKKSKEEMENICDNCECNTFGISVLCPDCVRAFKKGKKSEREKIKDFVEIEIKNCYSDSCQSHLKDVLKELEREA